MSVRSALSLLSWIYHCRRVSVGQLEILDSFCLSISCNLSNSCVAPSQHHVHTCRCSESVKTILICVPALLEILGDVTAASGFTLSSGNFDASGSTGTFSCTFQLSIGQSASGPTGSDLLELNTAAICQVPGPSKQAPALCR